MRRLSGLGLVLALVLCLACAGTAGVPPSPTPPMVVCTPPACGSDEQLHCPSSCPGGCGYVCATNTPRLPPPAPLLPVEAISPENAHRLLPLIVIYPGGRFTDLAFRGEAEIVTVGYDDEIWRWDLGTGGEIGRLGAPSEGALAIRVATSPDRSLIATGGGAWDLRVRLWDVATGTMRDLGAHDDLVAGLAFSPDGTLLASGDNADDVQVWAVESGQPVIAFQADVPGYGQRFSDLYWPDGDTLAAAGSNVIYWWDVAAGTLLQRLDIPQEAPFFVDVAFGRNTDRLAAVAQGDAVYVWERATGAWATWPVRPGADMRQVAFSPDERLLAAGSAADGLFLWDVAAQALIEQREPPGADIVALEFSPDGRYLAALGWDRAIWLFGIASGTPPAVP